LSHPGEGGYLPAPTEFMRELRRICDQHGILLMADEVQSGAGRSGKWWAIQHTGVEPISSLSPRALLPACPWA